MRTTVNLDDALVRRAQELTAISEKTALLHEALRALIARASAERLAGMGGSDKKARAARSRRPE